MARALQSSSRTAQIGRTRHGGGQGQLLLLLLRVCGRCTAVPVWRRRVGVLGEHQALMIRGRRLEPSSTTTAARWGAARSSAGGNRPVVVMRGLPCRPPEQQGGRCSTGVAAACAGASSGVAAVVVDEGGVFFTVVKVMVE